ncbi:septation protein SepH [Rathayibacter soli]|uniref:septation protein SepH n=1 Tax=Rathayibacter soli TaxID=3144168 RepID=UPI0027E4D795|nr:septation protein SepH [Glaciibacter superstes]
MQDLKVIGVENGALLAASDDGERYRIAIDEVLQSRLRQNKPGPATGHKVSPREVQSHIRSGLTAEEVSSLTGAAVEYVQRFEGPILAEREHIVASALGVPVHTNADVDPLGEAATFGVVIRERLASLSATGERWASWKEQDGGWIVKLSFTADEIDHDARWAYDSRKHALSPLNSEATTLSQQGELQGGLIPRLRAVTPSVLPDESRFDSGAFSFPDEAVHAAPDAAPHLEPAPFGRTSSASNNAIAVTAIKRAEDDTQKDQHQTADLLEALRRRRGEREAAGAELSPAAIDVPLDDFDGLQEAPELPKRQVANSAGSRGSLGKVSPSKTAPGKKGRTSMPSWDEIVFGARTDDDLA